MQREQVVRHTMDNFRRIVQALRTSHRVAEDLHLTMAQLFVISVLQEAEGPLSIRDIARGTQTDPSTASVVVGRLAESGYVKRSRSAADTRRAEISLTARGRALHRAHPQSAPQRRLSKALEGLSQRDAAAFDRLLELIVTSMGLREEPTPMMFAEGSDGESET